MVPQFAHISLTFFAFLKKFSLVQGCGAPGSPCRDHPGDRSCGVWSGGRITLPLPYRPELCFGWEPAPNPTASELQAAGTQAPLPWLAINEAGAHEEPRGYDAPSFPAADMGFGRPQRPEEPLETASQLQGGKEAEAEGEEGGRSPLVAHPQPGGGLAGRRSNKALQGRTPLPQTPGVTLGVPFAAPELSAVILFLQITCLLWDLGEGSFLAVPATRTKQSPAQPRRQALNMDTQG